MTMTMGFNQIRVGYVVFASANEAKKAIRQASSDENVTRLFAKDPLIVHLYPPQ